MAQGQLTSRGLTLVSRNTYDEDERIWSRKAARHLFTAGAVTRRREARLLSVKRDQWRVLYHS